MNGEEERVVAELELLGVRYLSRRTADRAERARPLDVLPAHSVRQPSARPGLGDRGALGAP